MYIDSGTMQPKIRVSRERNGTDFVSQVSEENMAYEVHKETWPQR
jgi:hypothetical protein